MILNVDDVLSRAAALAPDPDLPLHLSPRLDLERARRYYVEGLTGRCQRDAAMDQILLGMFRDPESFGLSAPPTVVEAAELVLNWLIRNGHHSADWVSRPDPAYWRREITRKATAIRGSERAVELAMGTQVSDREAETVFATSGYACRGTQAHTAAVRLQREVFAFALLNFCKYACRRHGKSPGPGTELTLTGERLAQFPGASRATYTRHIGWASEVGLILERGSTWTRGQAKTLRLDLDPHTAFDAGETAILLDLYRSHKIHHQRSAHAIHALRGFDDEALAARYGRGAMSPVFQLVRRSLAQLRAPLPECATSELVTGVV